MVDPVAKEPLEATVGGVTKGPAASAVATESAKTVASTVAKKPAIQVTYLTKNFGDKNVIKDISFEVSEGEIFGFLGPNGAGKTTTVMILNGIIEPTSGSVKVMGYDPSVHPEKVHALAGTLTETARMYEQMTGIENLVFYSKLFGIEDKFLYKNIESILHDVGLHADKDMILKDYSTGMKKKLSLARTFLHSPRLLLLDEPTSGLDPESAKRINTLIKDYAVKRGATIFLCTHQLRYAQDICTQYGFINRGELICAGSLSEIIAQSKFEKYLYLHAQLSPNDTSLDDFKVETNKYRVPMTGAEGTSDIIEKIVLNGGKVFDVKIREPNLEELYFSLVKDEEDSHE